jgi:uncharacterized protein with PIN domain
MKFILTRELGRLAKWLRILGLDTVYFNQDNLSTVIIEALRQDRIIITRNHRLPRALGIRIVVIEKERFKEQIQELFRLLPMKLDLERMFRRCIICNEELLDIEKQEVKDKVPEYVFKTQGDFITCPKCNRIYWQGTHWGNVSQTIKELNLC